jgi:predicted aspartyl protease
MAPSPPIVALALALVLSGAAVLRADPARGAEPEADVAPVQPAGAPRESVTIPADARGFYQVLAQVNGAPARTAGARSSTPWSGRCPASW